MTIFLENVVPSINVLNWFLENNTCQVDEKIRDEYILLKNSIEGWKKGSNLRTTIKISSEKLETDKIRENLSLYLNQLSATNYITLEKKIIKEIDNSNEAMNILLDLILNIGMQQENNLELLITLVSNLKLLPGTIDKLELKLNELHLVKIDQSNYNQLCIDTRNNLIFKNGVIFLALIFSRSTVLNIEIILNKFLFLEGKFQNDDKEIVEKYMEVYIELLKRVHIKLKQMDKAFYDTIINKLNSWKNDKIQFTSRTRFAILDLFDNLKIA
jgi:hypothetical protein